MDKKKQYDLEKNYELRMNYTIHLKRSLNLRISILKLLIIILLFYFVYVPSYINFYDTMLLINNIFAYSFNFVANSYRSISIILFIIPVIFIIRGNLPGRKLFFLIGMINIVFFDKEYNLWILKIIGLILLIKLPEILQKLSKSFKDYESYKGSYFELQSLKNTFDNILKQYFANIVVLTLISYFLFFSFQVISIKIGSETSIVLAIIFLPLIIFTLFNSPEVFTSIRQSIAKKNQTDN